MSDVAPYIGDVLDTIACAQASTPLYPAALSPAGAFDEAGVPGVSVAPDVPEGRDGLVGMTVGGIVTGAALA